MGSCRRHDYDIPNRLVLLSGAVKGAAIGQGCAGRVRHQNYCCDEHPAHRPIRTNRPGCVNEPVLRDDEMPIARAGVSRNLSAPSGAMD